MALNHGVCEARLTRDPECKTAGTTRLAKLGLAINEKRKGETSTVFIDAEAWAKTAEVIEQYCHKGDPVIVEYSLKQDTWQDKDTGQKRNKIYLRIDQFHFVPGHDYKKNEPQPEPEPEPTAAGDVAGDDDIPF